MNLLILAWSLAVSLLFGDALAPVDPLAAAATPAVEVRDAGVGEIERLCALYDELPECPEKLELEARIDALSGQRYATYSRLFWYRDIEDAKRVARATNRPILSLRMLGRLDQDLSCANSRFFRVVLYANRDVSTYLREHFVLHWSSERPVPRVTIDMGDGRRIETTLGGNSAHYVLDAEGRPIDVLPGLYSPVAFIRALQEVEPLAELSPTLGDTERVWLLREHFERSGAAAVRLWGGAEADALGAVTQPEPGLVTAERITINKARVEMPIVKGVFGLNAANAVALAPERVAEARLDTTSRALIARLRPLDWSRERTALGPRGIDVLAHAFEREIARDTRQNELDLRPRARALFLQGDTPLDFATLNAAIYAQVFVTPADDPWLGLGNPLVFSAVPNDGYVQ
ncbi:MAG: hypothetical protein JNL28_03490 [Planctomycetes bacterium]|nr:hypothetical protein [Planctomycetota bacterium]